MWKVTSLLTPALWPRCSRSWALFLLPFWSLVLPCRCCRFMCTKVLASAHSSSAWLQAASLQRLCSRGFIPAATQTHTWRKTRRCCRITDSGRGRAALSRVHPLCRRALSVGRDSAWRTGTPRRGGKLRHYGRGELGACSGRPRKYRACDRVDRHGHVCLPCIRGAAGCHALC